MRRAEEALGAPERVVEVGAVGLELRGQPAVQHQAPATGLHPAPHRRLRAAARPHHLHSLPARFGIWDVVAGRWVGVGGRWRWLGTSTIYSRRKKSGAGSMADVAGFCANVAASVRDRGIW
jgi:hypothetical protein